MSDTLDPLVLDFVEWIAKQPRPYAEALDAWRTSCPRLTVWEDAADLGYVERRIFEGQGVCLIATDAGQQFLQSRRGSSRDAVKPRSDGERQL
jgi:hypothetical protein